MATAPAADEARFVENPSWRRTPIDRIGPISYWVDEPSPALGVSKRDPTLARWALEAWDRAVAGRLCFYRVEARLALVRVYWGQVGDGLGRMQAIPVGDLRGAEVYVHPRPERFSPALAAACEADRLLRDAIVYRTLLHEIGHALGLVHTTGVDDAMYFGGDVLAYYRRFRDPIADWRELRTRRGLSPVDLARIRGKYPERPHRRAPKPPKDPSA